MNDYSNRTKHDLYLPGSETSQEPEMKMAGHALNFEGTNYFLMKLWERPRDTYYLSKNRDGDGTYTLFAKRIDAESGIPARFQNPVGVGRFRADLKSHIEVSFTLSRVRVYLSLYPTT